MLTWLRSLFSRHQRAFVLLLLTAALTAFTTAAETRATVLVKMAEEVGMGRFFEEKAARPHAEAVRLRQLQASRKPEELPLRAEAPSAPRRPAPVIQRGWAPRSPRGPPHFPRAPPVAA